VPTWTAINISLALATQVVSIMKVYNIVDYENNFMGLSNSRECANCTATQ
jgi:hypothetical protein